MKINFNKKIIISLIITIIIIVMQKSSFATGVGAQASGTTGTLYNKTVTYFFELIRQMESIDGTLKKASNIGEGYVDTSGNGIDCHLEKNTEYGAITLLAASAYGKVPLTDSASTGLGDTGLFQMNAGNEYVANIYKTAPNATPMAKGKNGQKTLTSADPRYVNEYVGEKGDYTSQGYVISGDGLIETDGWGGGYSYWFDSTHPIMTRCVGGFFGYWNDYNEGVNARQFTARAVVVCGPGL